MTNLQTLNEAFAELERRADAATGDRSVMLQPPVRRRHALTVGRVAAVAGTAVVVAGLAVGAVVLAPDDNGSPRVGVPPGKTGTTTAAAPTTSAPKLPQTDQELARRFGAVLGDLARFTVTEKQTQKGTTGGTIAPWPPDEPEANRTLVTPPPGPTEYVMVYIAGTLTSHGSTGGFDLVVYSDEDARASQCPDGDLGDRTCVERKLPDGAKLIIDDSALQVPGGRTYGVDYLGADGTVVSIHVSNLASPKGPIGSPKLAGKPPLTTAQLVKIVSSELWSGS